MKKTFSILFAAMALAACSKEISEQLELTSEGEGVCGAVTWVNVSSPSYKTYLGEKDNDTYPVYWSDNDVIQINGCNSKSISVVPENKSSATFAIDGVIDYPYCAVYPAAIASGYAENKLTVTLPSVQNYVEGSFDPKAAVLVGYATQGNVAFKNAMAFLKIKISGGTDTDAIKSVRVRANNSVGDADNIYGREPMSGEFTVDYTDGTPVFSRPLNDNSSVTLDCAEGVEQGKDLIIAVPAQEYKRGINIFVVDAQNHCQEFISKKAFNALAGRIYNTSLAFNGGMTYVGAGIYTACDWNALASMTTINGFCDEFKDEKGVDNLYADISEVSLQRFGGITEGAKYSYYDGILEGNNHSITTSDMRVPLFTYTGADSEVRNLNIGGTRPYFASTTGWGTALFALDVYGTVDNVTSDYQVTAIPDFTDITYYYGFCRNVKETGVVKNCTFKSDFTVHKSLQKKASGKDHTYVSLVAHSNAGQIVDCVNTGNVTFAENTGDYLYVSPIEKNMGVLTNFTNTGCFDIKTSHTTITGGVTAYGGGDITGCVNGVEGDATKGCITVDVCQVAAGKTITIGGIAGRGDAGVTDVNCGVIYTCKNYGVLTMTNNTPTSGTVLGLYRAAVGGIVGDIQYGAYGSDAKSHDFCVVDGCTNSGHLTMENQSVSNVPMFMGGIVGLVLPPTASSLTSGALVLTKATSEYNGLYIVTRVNNKNTGILEMAAMTNAPAGNQTGARLNYIGGIVGFAYGIGRTSDADAHYAVIRGVQDGVIKLGSSKTGCFAAGGLIGGGCYFKCDGAATTNVDYQATDIKTGGSAALYRGMIGAVAGMTLKHSQITAAINASMSDNTNLVCSASIEDTSFKGFAGITSAKSAHLTSTGELHSLQVKKTCKLNGVAITAGDLYGGGTKTLN